LAGGERLAQLALLFVQAGLGSTLGAERLFLRDDDGSLPGVALFGLLQALGGEIRAGGLRVYALSLEIQDHHQRDEYACGNEPEAWRAHAVCSCSLANWA
jgi:hypothetical protein